jgi:hypothetical protein
MKGVAIPTVLIWTIFFLAGCIEESPESPVGKKIVDEFEYLPDGGSISFRLSEGIYRIVVSSDEEVNVIIEGASECNVYETKYYDVMCPLERTGILTVENPTIFGLGRSASVSIQVEVW